MPKLNADGTPTGEYGARVFKKTIYDPDVVSDDEFIKRGLEAANVLPKRIEDVLLVTTATEHSRFLCYMESQKISPKT